MNIILYIEPKSLTKFIEVTKILKGLEIENRYRFNPFDFIFSEIMISNYIQISMEIEEYLKLKYCINAIKNNLI